MSLLVMKEKRRRKNSTGLLSTHSVNVSGADLKKHSAQSRARSLGRFAGSWAALSLGLFTCYTAMHYAPALISLDKVLGVSGPKSQAVALDDPKSNPFAPYLELFEVDRTYLRAGQSIRAEYQLPRGAAVDLRVVKCESALVVEVFRCNPVAKRDITVSDRSGSREFRFSEAGFYHFYDDARRVGDKDYRVVWTRG